MYGSATFKSHVGEDGRRWVEVVQVDEVDGTIAMSFGLLAGAGELVVTPEGDLLLAGDPQYRYRPLRFACLFGAVGFAPDLLILERVR
jgi:hypothetical protein